MVIGCGRLKEPRIIILGHGSRCKELSSNPSEEIKKKWRMNKRQTFKKRVLALKIYYVDQRSH